MNIKKHIPNFLTCCNLLCGCIGITEIFQGRLENASYLILLACVFDFFDGFAARLLKVTSPIGKELDSLADVVTFGVLPGFIVYKLLTPLGFYECFADKDFIHWPSYYKYLSLSIPVFSALRLAKFNIDTRQSESFIGVPTPANAILISSLPLILTFSGSQFIREIILNPFFLISLTLIMSYLLVAEIPLFALKFKNFKWPDNKIRFTFMGLSLLLFVFLTWTAIPIIIFLYIALSVIENWLKAKS